LKICIWSIPLHIIVPLPNHQFGVPSFAEIEFFFETKSLLEKIINSASLFLVPVQKHPNN